MSDCIYLVSCTRSEVQGDGFYAFVLFLKKKNFVNGVFCRLNVMLGR